MMYWLLRGIGWQVAALPEAWARKLAQTCGDILARVIGLRRKYVLSTLARCFPEKTPAEHRFIYDQMCKHQALNLMELMRYYGGRQDELESHIEIHGQEHIGAALKRERGALLLLAHCGNYVLAALLASKITGFPLSIVYKRLKIRSLNQLWEDLRTKAGVEGVSSRLAYRHCLRVLKQNRMVGFMLDQNRPEPRGIFVDFFGQPACTSPGLAYLSAHSGAPVIPVFMRRTSDARHVIEIREPLPPPEDRQPATIQAATALYTRIIEEEIRRYPDQWLWLHKRWKSRPRGEIFPPPEAALL